MGVKRNLTEAGISNENDKITEDEAALYDRQIRLWGMECQKRLREARILVIGINGVGAEVVKNLALTGVKSITILDDSEVNELDRTAQFFVASCELGKMRSEASLPAIQELNPNVKVSFVTGDPNSKSEQFFCDYDVVLATCLPMDVLIKIDKICREHDIQFYCSDTWGFYGYCFLNLKKHKFKYLAQKESINADPKRKATEEEEKVFKDKVKKQILKRYIHDIVYSSLAYTMLTKVGEGLRKRVNKVFILLHIINYFREMFNRYPLPASRESDIEELKKIRDLVCTNLGFEQSKIADEVLAGLFGELSPVCAAVGGILANEIIKGVSKTGHPVHNFFFFDGNEFIGANETIVSH